MCACVCGLLYDDIAVLPSSTVSPCQSSILLTLACALHSLGSGTPITQQTHIPASGKSTRTKRQL